MSSEIEKRLYHFEVIPPPAVWDKIVIALDQPGGMEFSSRIYNFQMQPPPGIWQKILSELYQTGDFQKPLPFIKRIKPYYRYAAAAVFVGIITFLISFFINKQNIASVAEKESLPVHKQKTILPQTKIDQENNHRSETAVLSNHLPEPAKKRMLTMSFFNHTKNTQVDYHSPALLQTNYSADNLKNDAEYIYDSPPAISYDQSKISRINNYVVLLRPDGNIIRISKKFADVIGCIYTSSSNSNNNNCDDQINSWRKKMAKSVVTPSQDNFMDILTMIKSLQEN